MSLFKDKNGELKLSAILVASLLVVVLLWASTFIFLNTSKSGEIGDSFGMVNALFSALAFSLLIYTSLLQTQELKLQRKELEENRKQLESSAKAHNELVELTRAINKDKLIPQYKVEELIIGDKETKLFLRVYYGDCKLIGLNTHKNEQFSWALNEDDGTLKLRKEGDIVGPISIITSRLNEFSKVVISYQINNDNVFCQDIIDINGAYSITNPYLSSNQLS
ncbi:hypothetical protein [Fulvivirga lutea]|uniref:Uncharacterized protein n=1 Tax=Fulvivirga lutea TaxID=2810512 RepID=A0A974WMV5_9BACT|nr:hypothetical protein [Fulvivirga lutea]QSE99200.1 hypothetical protein JR347_08955 [Fulvivirga lutea]